MVRKYSANPRTKHIATVSSERKGELARMAGAHQVLNYRTDDLAAAVLAENPPAADIHRRGHMNS
jgi:NADPH:quinone reductase-like Zn-dependent oxidoreductase